MKRLKLPIKQCDGITPSPGERCLIDRIEELSDRIRHYEENYSAYGRKGYEKNENLINDLKVQRRELILNYTKPKNHNV